MKRKSVLKSTIIFRSNAMLIFATLYITKDDSSKDNNDKKILLAMIIHLLMKLATRNWMTENLNLRPFPQW
ncbi:MAG: hypothetical protein IPJ45_13470 [Ignavibacteria bacterium]|nr:hypothetical protein [Ignavibacteria bacterium]